MERCPVAAADEFPHLGNPAYIYAVRDERLDREVVHLENVCWLFFRKRFAIKQSG